MMDNHWWLDPTVLTVTGHWLWKNERVEILRKLNISLGVRRTHVQHSLVQKKKLQFTCIFTVAGVGSIYIVCFKSGKVRISLIYEAAALYFNKLATFKWRKDQEVERKI